MFDKNGISIRQIQEKTHIYDTSHPDQYATLTYYNLGDIARNVTGADKYPHMHYYNAADIIASYLSTPHAWNVVTAWEWENNHEFTSCCDYEDLISDAMGIGGPLDLFRWINQAKGAAFFLDADNEVYAVKPIAMDFLYTISPNDALKILEFAERRTKYNLIE